MLWRLNVFGGENSSSSIRMTSSVIVDVECSNHILTFLLMSNICAACDRLLHFRFIFMIRTGSAGIKRMPLCNVRSGGLRIGNVELQHPYFHLMLSITFNIKNSFFFIFFLFTLSTIYNS